MLSAGLLVNLVCVESGGEAALCLPHEAKVRPLQLLSPQNPDLGAAADLAAGYNLLPGKPTPRDLGSQGGSRLI